MTLFLPIVRTENRIGTVKIWRLAVQFLSSYWPSAYSVSERQSLSEMAAKAFESLRKGTAEILKIILHAFSP